MIVRAYCAVFGFSGVFWVFYSPFVVKMLLLLFFSALAIVQAAICNSSNPGDTPFTTGCDYCDPATNSGFSCTLVWLINAYTIKLGVRQEAFVTVR